MAEKKVEIPQLDLNNLPEAPELQEPEQDMPEFSTGSNKREYSTSAATLDRLNKMPKEALKDRFGIDIDALIKSEKRYGVLEALAYGDQTPRPIHIRIPIPGTHAIDTLATVRLVNSFIGKEGKPVIFMDNIHRVSLKYDVDENGVVKKDNNGQPKMVYDRNPIKEGDIVKWGGKELSKEQTDALRLTGHLGEPFPDKTRKGEPIQLILSVDPFNNHELVSVDCAYVSKTLKAKPEFKVKGADGETITFDLTNAQIGDLSLGRGVWVGDKERGNYHVQYNAATRRLEKTPDLKSAQKQERELKEKTREAKAAAKAVAENMKVGQKL